MGGGILRGIDLEFTVLKVFLILLILSSVVVGHDTFIDTPWEIIDWKNNNPGIDCIGSDCYYYPRSMDYFLDELKLGNISTKDLDEDTKELIAKAKDARSNASEYKMDCIDARLYYEEFSEKYGWGLDSPLRVCSLYTSAIEPYTYSFRYLFCVRSVLSEMIETEYDLDNCIIYGKYWESTMSRSMGALEQSMIDVEANYSAAEESFEKLNYSGVCDSDYTGVGHTSCLEVRTALNTIESGSKEGSYGTYNTVWGYVEGIQKEVYSHRPNIVYYSLAMNLIWQERGVIDTLDALRAKADTAYSNADREYKNSRGSVETKQTRIKALLDDLKGEELGKITVAKTEEGTVGESEQGTIAERFTEIRNQEQDARTLFMSAETAYSSDMHGYLKEAIKRMSISEVDYDALEQKIPVLKSDAEEVVEKEKSTADEKIAALESIISSEATSDTVRNYLKAAKDYYEKGENATTFGMQFYYYNRAVEKAKSGITTHQDQSFDEAKEIGALKAELEEMIQRAEADGLNTYDQEQTLETLDGAELWWANEEVEKSIGLLVASAELEYGWLEDKRAELIKKIKLVGGDADDLLTTMQIAEQGIVINGEIDYRKGIGGLKQLANAYADVEKEVDGYLKDIVSHSLMAEPEVFVDSVTLDEPSNITIDILVINTDEYESNNVELDVQLPISVDLMYSDITQGREYVSSLIMDGDTAKLYLKEVKPFSRQRIVFQTSETIAHTTKVKRTAVGLGDGSAAVSQEIQFRLDSPVNSLAVPDMENVRIDGRIPGRALSKGSHTLTARYNEEDAYNESIRNIKASPIGLNSKVEYEVVFNPYIDLDKVTFFVDPGVKMTSLNVFTLSGEGVGKKKKITDNRYSFEVSDLTANSEAVIRVSYILENSSNYVSQELALFAGTNMSDKVREIVDDARAAFSIGDTSAALAKVNEAKAEMKKEATDRAKAERKVDKIREEIKAELDEINTALSKAGGMNSSFYAKLQARADELGRRLNETSAKEPADALLALDEVDMNWRSKEVKAFRKDVFKKYNDLKERFAEAGNTSTPKEFLELESNLNKLEVSGRLEYVVELVKDLEDAEKLVVFQESAKAAARSGLRSTFEGIKDRIAQALEGYEREAKAAKGTEYSSMFKWTKSEVEKKVSEVGKIIGDGDPEFLDRKLKALDRTRQDLEGTLSLLKNQSEAKLGLVEKLYNSSKAGMEQADQERVEKRIGTMKSMLAAGEYVDSLRAGNKILEDIKVAKKDEGSLLLLGITALAILGVIAAYLFKQRGGIRKEEKKELKKLEKAEPDTTKAENQKTEAGS